MINYFQMFFSSIDFISLSLNLTIGIVLVLIVMKYKQVSEREIASLKRIDKKIFEALKELKKDTDTKFDYFHEEDDFEALPEINEERTSKPRSETNKSHKKINTIIANDNQKPNPDQEFQPLEIDQVALQELNQVVDLADQNQVQKNALPRPE